jgi:hypothetical protein
LTSADFDDVVAQGEDEGLELRLHAQLRDERLLLGPTAHLLLSPLAL